MLVSQTALPGGIAEISMYSYSCLYKLDKLQIMSNGSFSIVCTFLFWITNGSLKGVGASLLIVIIPIPTAGGQFPIQSFASSPFRPKICALNKHPPNQADPHCYIPKEKHAKRNSFVPVQSSLEKEGHVY